jgi:hypothetical protein
MTHEFLIALSATLLIDTGGGAFAAIGVVTGDPGKHARRPSHSSWRCGYCFWRSGDGRSQPHHHRCRHGRATRGQQFLFGGVPASGRFQNRGQGHTPLRSRPKFLALRRRRKRGPGRREEGKKAKAPSLVEALRVKGAFSPQPAPTEQFRHHANLRVAAATSGGCRREYERCCRSQHLCGPCVSLRSVC